jgi:tripartite-type tricarboxylate transporter receptor subunit TctC
MDRRIMRALVGACIVFMHVSGGARAEEPDEDFYKGKVVRIIVPTPPGGLFDGYSRLLAQNLPRHIAGSPTMILQNMAGAAGLVAANYMANVAPRDGSVIAAAYSATMTAPLLSPDGVKFDVKALSWIGSITKDPFVAYAWHTARAKSLEELKTKEGLFGGTSIGSAPIDYAILGKALFGLKLNIVTGYAGTADVNLAMQRGEIEGTFGVGWNSLKVGQADWLRDKQVIVLTQFGLTRHPELPDVPMFADLATNKADRQALELYLPRQEYSRPYYGPPGIPASRLNMLRRAFDATIRDPAFLADAERLKAPVDGPASGEDLAATADRIAETPPDVVKRVVGMFTDFRAK